MSIGFYFELLWRNYRGYIRHNLRKLKQIKYFLGISLSIIFFGVLVWILSSDIDLPKGLMDIFSSHVNLGGIHFILATILAASWALFWFVMPGKFPLVLSDIDYNVLQSAPLSRRSIIQFSLVKSQRDNLIGSLLLWIYISLYFKQVFIGYLLIWLLVHVLIDLHMKCCRLWKFRNSRQNGHFPVCARIVLYLVLAIFGWFLFMYGWEVFLSVKADVIVGKIRPDTIGPLFLGAMYESVYQSGLLLLLSPFIWVLSPFFPTVMGAGIMPYLVLLILLVIHWEWLVRSMLQYGEIVDRSDQTEKSHKSGIGQFFVKVLGDRRTRVPFKLTPVGLPEWALYWKHFLIYFRLPMSVAFLLAITIPVVYFIFLLITGIPMIMVIITAAYSFLGLFFGLFILISMFQKDLSGEFEHFDLVRTFPVEEQKLLAAKVLAISTWAALLGIVLLGMYAASMVAINMALLYHTLTPLEQHELARLPFQFVEESGQLFLICLGILAAYVGLVSLLVIMLTFLNLFFPGWIPKAKRRENIFSVGQSMLVMITLFLSTILSVLPAGLVIGAIALVHYLLNIPFVSWEITLFGFLFLIVSGAETFYLTHLAGKLWNRIDPAFEQV